MKNRALGESQRSALNQSPPPTDPRTRNLSGSWGSRGEQLCRARICPTDGPSRATHQTLLHRQHIVAARSLRSPRRGHQRTLKAAPGSPKSRRHRSVADILEGARVNNRNGPYCFDLDLFRFKAAFGGPIRYSYEAAVNHPISRAVGYALHQTDGAAPGRPWLGYRPSRQGSDSR